LLRYENRTAIPKRRVCAVATILTERTGDAYIVTGDTAAEMPGPEDAPNASARADVSAVGEHPALAVDLKPQGDSVSG
jgi:hypothetical protein